MSKEIEALEKISDEQVRNAAGHPDAVPKIYIDYFVNGAKWMREALASYKGGEDLDKDH